MRIIKRWITWRRIAVTLICSLIAWRAFATLTVDGVIQPVMRGTDSAALATELGVVETHQHSGERWMGAAAAASGTTHTADQAGAGAAGAEAAAFSIDAGNDDWGTWTQIIGSTDTPVDSGLSYFDLHEILITATEHNSALYMVQIAGKATAPTDDPADGIYTEFLFVSTGASPLALAPPVVVQDVRWAAGTNIWARNRVPNQAGGGTMGFYVGLHEYDN